MSIQIDVARISGFRGLHNVEIKLSRVTVLLGINNSGKTSVIKALQLALGDYSRYLADEDFHICENEKAQERIVVDLRFIPINNNKRSPEFSETWQAYFGDKIQSEVDGKQFVVIRTTARHDKIKGGYLVERYHLTQWPEKDNWMEACENSRNRIRSRLDAIPYISIEAQRDIATELKEKASFIGKILSSIEYNEQDVLELEQMVAEINRVAIEKSEPLKSLREHLDGLGRSVEMNGQSELTPFPKKIRDLSKRFGVSFGDSEKHSFSIEYHGMGTRSWASMLTVKAFIDLLQTAHKKEDEPFFPIVAAEEPENHLHPNAQRTLYDQLLGIPGQVIISTHSPYIAGVADLHELRYLKRTGPTVTVHQLQEEFEGDDCRKLRREVIHSRGELLFSKIIVLSEGETEEQVLPVLFEAYSKRTPFLCGVSFVGVHGSGARYLPFFILAKSFDIPVFVFSDGEEKIKKELEKNYKKVFNVDSIEDASNIVVLEGTDFEGYLLDNGYQTIIETSIVACEENENYINEWIRTKNGTVKGSAITDKPKCSTCHQPIYEPIVRDYHGDSGRKEALLDILQKKKPMYAKAIAENLAILPKDQFPGKITQLFDGILCLIGGAL